MRKIATAIALTGIMLTGCATTPNTDDTLVTQMENSNITIGNTTDRKAQDAINAVCEARKNDVSHDWVLDITKSSFGDNWTDREAERFIEIAYANECPKYAK